MYTHRTYIEKSNDFEMMAQFVSRLNTKQDDDWLTGRLYAWRYGRWSEKSQDDSQFEKQAELFWDGGSRLCGIVITENFGYDYYLLSEKDEELIQAMAAFLKNGGGLWEDYSVVLSREDTILQNVLAEQGLSYHEDADMTYIYAKEQITLPQVSLPAGFRLTDQKDFADAEAVERQRFFSFNPHSSFDGSIERAYRYSRKNPFLVPALQTVLLNECGSPVSSCMGYWDRNTNIMEVEVVATLSTYENRGFAKAVISTCIQRGLCLGVTKVEISAWEDKTKHLYALFGKPDAVQKIKMKKW